MNNYTLEQAIKDGANPQVLINVAKWNEQHFIRNPRRLENAKQLRRLAKQISN